MMKQVAVYISQFFGILSFIESKTSINERPVWHFAFHK